MSNDNVLELKKPGVSSAVRDALSAVLRDGARTLLAQAVEAEVTEFLARYRDEQDAAGRTRMVRNGHLPERAIQTGLGPVRGEFVLRPESVCETDLDNAASKYIGEGQQARSVRKMRRRVAPAWCRQGSDAPGARCSNLRMRPTYASGRSRSRRICGLDIRGGPCRSAVR